MQYEVEVFSADPGEPPYEFAAATRAELIAEVERIAGLLREGDTLQIKTGPLVFRVGLDLPRVVTVEERLAEARAQAEGAA